MKSSLRISPGCVGLVFFTFVTIPDFALTHHSPQEHAERRVRVLRDHAEGRPTLSVLSTSLRMLAAYGSVEMEILTL
jgi:hypothetical protein